MRPWGSGSFMIRKIGLSHLFEVSFVLFVASPEPPGSNQAHKSQQTNATDRSASYDA